MITANEARQQTIKNKDKAVASELNNLEKQIKEAVSEGVFSISNDDCLYQDNIEELRRLGYDVHCETQYNEEYYSITWG